MKRFVVSYIDWFNNDLQSYIYEAKDELEAIKAVAIEQCGFYPEFLEDIKDVESFKGFCFDSDCMMNVIEV